MGFAPHNPMQPFRPLHVWGHQTIDQSMMHVAETSCTFTIYTAASVGTTTTSSSINNSATTTIVTRPLVLASTSTCTKFCYTRDSLHASNTDTVGDSVRGKLNNLMVQLRKNCNHPDLLEGACDGSTVYPPINQLVEQCGKFRLLDKLLTELLARNHKVLIFSQWTKVLNIIDYYFSEKGLEACRIDGSVQLSERRRQIQEFNDPESNFKIFLLSTRAGGLGINLTSADTCILYDSDRNPQMDFWATMGVLKVLLLSSCVIFLSAAEIHEFSSPQSWTNDVSLTQVPPPLGVVRIILQKRSMNYAFACGFVYEGAYGDSSQKIDTHQAYVFGIFLFPTSPPK